MLYKHVNVLVCLAVLALGLALTHSLWLGSAEAVSVTVDTVDQAGSHVDAWVHIDAWRSTPLDVDVAEGGWVGGLLRYGWTQAQGGTTVSEGNTYLVDPRTGSVTSESTPSSTQVDFLIAPLQVQASMVDHVGTPVADAAASFTAWDEVLGVQDLPLTIPVADGWWVRASVFCGYSQSGGEAAIEGGMINEWDLPDGYGTVPSGDGSTKLHFVVEPLDVEVAMVDHSGTPVSGGNVNFVARQEWHGYESLPFSAAAADGWSIACHASLGCTDSPRGEGIIQGGMINEWDLPDGYGTVASGDGSTKLHFVVEPLDVEADMVDPSGTPVSGGTVNFAVRGEWQGYQSLPLMTPAADGWYVGCHASLGCTDSPRGDGIIHGGMINEWDLPDGYGTVASGDGSTKLHFVVEPLDVEVDMVDPSGTPVSGGTVNFAVRGDWQGYQSLPLTTPAGDGWHVACHATMGYSASPRGEGSLLGEMINEWDLPDGYAVVASGDGTTKLRFVVRPTELSLATVDASEQHNPLSCGELWVNPWATLEWLGPLSVSGTVPVAEGWYVQADAHVCGRMLGKVFTVLSDHTLLIRPYSGSPWDPIPEEDILFTPGVTAAKYVFDIIEPTITIASPLAQDYPVGKPVLFEFSAVSNSGGTMESLTGTLDNTTPVESGQWLTPLEGEHSLFVHAVDSNGNCSCRTVVFEEVVDTTPPVITLLGDNPLTLEFGTPYAEPGYTASDVCEGDLTADVVVTGTVDHTTLGAYLLHYNVSDFSGNKAKQKTRTVNVVDTIPPVITLLGNDPLTWECGAAYSDPGHTATDNYDGDIATNVVVTGSVDHMTLGSYILRFNVNDSSGNPALEKTRTVHVVDTTPPVIALLGDNPLAWEWGIAYADPGCAATDVCEGDLTADVVVTGAVNHAVLGSYVLQYNVTDSSGNPAEQKSRTVEVVHTIPLEMTSISELAPWVISLTWMSRPGVLYSVWSCFDLDIGQWLEEATVSSGGDTTTWVDDNAVGLCKFYRIRIE